MKYILSFTHRAYEGLRLIFDPSIEGHPHASSASRRSSRSTKQTNGFTSRRNFGLGF